MSVCVGVWRKSEKWGFTLDSVTLQKVVIDCEKIKEENGEEEGNSLEATFDLSSESECDGERRSVDYLCAVLDLLILLSYCHLILSWQPLQIEWDRMSIVNHSSWRLRDFDTILWLCQLSNASSSFRKIEENESAHLNWVHGWVVENVKC